MNDALLVYPCPRRGGRLRGPPGRAAGFGSGPTSPKAGFTGQIGHYTPRSGGTPPGCQWNAGHERRGGGPVRPRRMSHNWSYTPPPLRSSASQGQSLERFIVEAMSRIYCIAIYITKCRYNTNGQIVTGEASRHGTGPENAPEGPFRRSPSVGWVSSHQCGHLEVSVLRYW